MHSCSCLCGEVQFDIYTQLHHAIHCHCRDCRKSHGSPFITLFVVLPQYFTITKGQSHLKRYPENPVKTGRYVCDLCGSKLYAESEKGKPVSVYTSALLDDSAVRAMAHVNVESKCSTVVISDDLPQFAGQIGKEEFMALAR